MKPRNRYCLPLALLAGLLGTVLAGCGAKSPEVSYYSLYAVQAPPAGVKAAGATVLAVGPVTAPDILRRSQIATGSGAGSYRLSDYHRWAGDVEKDFARALAEKLSSRGDAGQVVLFPAPQQVDCQLAVDILAMEGELGREARLSVSWSLLDSRDASVAVVRRSDFRNQPEDAGYDAWVRAQQRNIAALGGEIAAAVDSGGCRRK